MSTNLARPDARHFSNNPGNSRPNRWWVAAALAIVLAILAVDLGAGPAAAASVPCAPGGHHVSAWTQKSVTIRWTTPSCSGSSAITGYRIQRRTDSTSWARIDEIGAARREYTDPGLTNGVRYHYRVRAVNKVGASAASAASSVVVGTPMAPHVTSTSGSDRAISVGWAQPTNIASSISYEVELREGSGAWLLVTTTTATSATIGSLKNGTSYTVRVRARSSYGHGPYSSISSAVIPQAVPAAPGAPTVVVGDSSITASWSAPADNGSAITSYEYQVGTRSGWSAETVAVTNRSVRLAHLTNGAEYQVRIRARNAVGLSAWSAGSAWVMPRGTLDPPVLQSADASDRTVKGDWSAPDSPGWSVAGYEVQLHDQGGWGPIRWVEQTNVVWPQLANGVTYRLRVRAVSGAHRSEWSLASKQLVPAGTPEKVGKPGVTFVGGLPQLQWQAPNGNGAAISGYVVQWRAAAGSWSPPVDLGSTPTWIHGSATAASTYEYRIAAVNRVGQGNWSEIIRTTVSATGSGQTPPGPIARQPQSDSTVRQTLLEAPRLAVQRPRSTTPRIRVKPGPGTSRTVYRTRPLKGNWTTWKYFGRKAHNLPVSARQVRRGVVVQVAYRSGTQWSPISWATIPPRQRSSLAVAALWSDHPTRATVVVHRPGQWKAGRTGSGTARSRWSSTVKGTWTVPLLGQRIGSLALRSGRKTVTTFVHRNGVVSWVVVGR